MNPKYGEICQACPYHRAKGKTHTCRLGRPEFWFRAYDCPETAKVRLMVLEMTMRGDSADIGKVLR
jgi:hypothetical protein